MKVLFSLGIGLIVLERVMMIGRWSEDSFFSVFQEVEGRREKEARDKSGEVLLSLALFGRRVGVSSFRIPTAESPMSFARSLPREQEMLLCHASS